MAFLYGRAGRLTAKTGGFRPGQELTELGAKAGGLKTLKTLLHTLPM